MFARIAADPSQIYVARRRTAPAEPESPPAPGELRAA
jgi:hypothetical protein